MSRSPNMPRVRSETSKNSSFISHGNYSWRLVEEGGHTVPRSPDKKDDRSLLLERFRERARIRCAKNDSTQEQYELDVSHNEFIYSSPKRFTDLELGRLSSEHEPELPVLAFKDIFLESVANNQITICTAETGAGKSTQLPQYLLEMGYIINMTQPRRISASLVAEQVQKELTGVLDEEAEGLVGCHTAGENTIVEGKTRITVLTDGLRLVQEFGRRDELDNEVLIIDEVHEWNTNIDTLVAAVKRLAKLKPELRVVILSATMEAEKLATYFENNVQRPPVIEIPGRNFAVEKKEEPDSTIVEQAIKYADDGHNILIFLPGVREIEDSMDALNEALMAKGILNATILPLHSKLSKQEQESVMGLYPGPKIICATNIAQTSITIPDVTRVIMSGLERRTEIDAEGVSSLNLRPVSRADMIQQSGRCGRVEDGEAVLTRLNNETDFIAHGSRDRTDYPIPEILRTDVDRNTLLIASDGLDISELEFFHPIEPSVIARSKHALRILGAFDEEGNITDLGRRMIKLPMRPMYARMVTYAEDERYTTNVRTSVAAMVAAMEVGGLPSWLRGSSRQWRDHVNETDDSDHLSQLRLFIASQEMSDRDKDNIGLDVHNIERAQELYRKVCKRTGVQDNPKLEQPNEEEVKQIRQAVLAGLIDYAYVRNGRGYVRAEGTTGEVRMKSNRSTVDGLPSYAVGTPVGVERKRGGILTKEGVVQDVTATTVAELGMVATWLCEWKDTTEFSWAQDRLQRIQRQFFKSLPTGVLRILDAEPTPEALKKVEQHLIDHSGSALGELKTIKKELEGLQQLTVEPLPEVTVHDLRKVIRDAMAGRLLSLNHIDQIIRQNMDEQGLHLDTQISPEDRQIIRANAPTQIEVGPDNLNLEYSLGVPQHRITDPKVVRDWPDEVHLPDGRPVKFVFKKKVHTIPQLKELALSN